MSDSDDQARAEELQASQIASDDPLEQPMAQMVEDQRRRCAARKETVGEAYTVKRDAAQDSIDTLLDNHELEASSVHQTQLKRLQELLSQKANMEVMMREKIKDLQASYNAHSRDLTTVVDRRIKEMK